MSDWSLTSGCFDMLHVGHTRFLQQASRFGDLFVAVASDTTIRDLKGRRPDFDQDVRLEMIQALGCVAGAGISPGSGILDFVPLLEEVRPKRLIVNFDGDYPEKKRLCEELGIEYIVINQASGPHTTQLHQQCRIPFRIDLAGGWLDQPFVSRLSPGAVIVASVEPTEEYNVRSGMATSTRRVAQRLWGTRLPSDDPHVLARLLFGSENPPGSLEIAGAQDALGICLPGINRLYYEGDYWPSEIDSCCDPETLRWLSRHLRLVEFAPRCEDTSILLETNITTSRAKSLAESADACWNAIQSKDLAALADSITRCYRAQTAMFPLMRVDQIETVFQQPGVLGTKLCGAGGGGYALAVCEEGSELGCSVTIRG